MAPALTYDEALAYLLIYYSAVPSITMSSPSCQVLVPVVTTTSA
mgnify:CR=1 FL=1